MKAPAVATTAAPSTRPAIRHPAADAARAFQAALKAGDAEAAGRLIAASPKPFADQPRRLARLVVEQQQDAVPFAIHDVRAGEDMAVVIVGHVLKPGAKAFDSDLWFLIRQADGWRVLGHPRDYDVPAYGFDEARTEAFRKLEEAAEERARQLKKEITGCEC